MSNEKLTAARRPCGSCPYRKDAPSGIWDRHEYEKLPAYDREGMEQPLAAFLCHQRDGNLCAGWLACHGPDRLLSLRLEVMLKTAEPELFNYTTDVPVFESGQEAHDHGVRDIDKPGQEARRKVAGLQKIMRSA